MSYGDFQDAKERIREAVDIVDVIGGYHPLRRQGRDFVTLCPWHNDSRPSLQINPTRQTWKCWVCDIGGDVFSFVMKQENLDFREALVLLAEKVGVPLPTDRSAAKTVAGSADDKNTLRQAAAWAETQYHEFLLRSPQADVARRYLEERGISQPSIENFRIGYSPDQWSWLTDRASGTPYSIAVLDAVGLLGKSESGKYYDRFRGRVMFPIRDVQDRPIGFGGRVLPELVKEGTEARHDKYNNSKETRLYSKSDTLYGLNIARQHLGSGAAASRTVAVVEGYTDVIMCHQFGVNNVVAVCGTALNQRHIRLLRRFADQVVLILDGDAAGQTRTNQVLDLFVAEQIDLRILSLPEEFDPCEFLLERGGEPFQTMMAQAVDALEHKLQVVTQGIDLSRDTHAANRALEQMLATLAKVNYDSTDSAARLREQQMLTRLARHFLAPESDIRTRLNAIRRDQNKKDSTREVPLVTERRLKLTDLPTREVEVLEILALHGEYIQVVSAEIAPAGFAHAASRTIYEIFDRLAADGETPDFGRVLSDIEDPVLQNLFVRIEEQASAKETHTSEPAVARLARLVQDFHLTKADGVRREKQTALEANKFGKEEEQEVFLQLLAQARARHGVSTPTDG